jgi:cytoskeletal protein RodZ
MKNIFEKLESAQQPNWNKEANWDKIESKLPKKKNRGFVLLWMQRAAAIIILVSGWIWGAMNKGNFTENQIAETENTVFVDTVYIVETKQDTLYLENTKYLSSKTMEVVMNDIVKYVKDTVYIEKAVPTMKDIAESTPEKPKPESTIQTASKNPKSIYITDYAEFVEIGDIQPRTTTKFGLFNRIFSPSAKSKRDFLIAINK